MLREAHVEIEETKLFGKIYFEMENTHDHRGNPMFG